MDLNNNPRTDAEKRYNLLVKRRRGLFRYWQRRTSIRFGGYDVASKIVINSIKARKALELMCETDKEINSLMKQLKQWRR